MKRFIGIILSVILLVGMLPVTSMAATPPHGVPRIIGDYEYSFRQEYSLNGGWYASMYDTWGVRVVNRQKSSYGQIQSQIDGYPVTCLSELFKDCTNLQTAPILPETTMKLDKAFQGCTNLQAAPTIPNSAKYIDNLFEDCINLTTVPNLPESARSLKWTFRGCKNLVNTPRIPDGVISMDCTFYGCISLEHPPILPSDLTEMNGTFSGCTSLKEVPVIPEKVTNMSSAFAQCKLITTPPTLPETAVKLPWTFMSCTSLQTAPVIPGSVINIDSMFLGCTSLKEAPILPESIKTMSGAFADTSITGEILISGQVNDMSNAFLGESVNLQKITVVNKPTKLGSFISKGKTTELIFPWYVEGEELPGTLPLGIKINGSVKPRPGAPGSSLAYPGGTCSTQLINKEGTVGWQIGGNIQYNWEGFCIPDVIEGCPIVSIDTMFSTSRPADMGGG